MLGWSPNAVCRVVSKLPLGLLRAESVRTPLRCVFGSREPSDNPPYFTSVAFVGQRPALGCCGVTSERLQTIAADSRLTGSLIRILQARFSLARSVWPIFRPLRPEALTKAAVEPDSGRCVTQFLGLRVRAFSNAMRVLSVGFRVGHRRG